MVTVLHTADTHLGYHQYHLEERATDFRDAFTRVIDVAIDESVDAVIHAGDLFNDSRPRIPALSHALSELRRLEAEGIPFLLVVGNHDGTRNQQWGDVFETLELATRLQKTGTEIGDTTFYGLDYVENSQRDALEYQYDKPDTEHAALVAHGLFTPIPNGDWDTEELLSRTNVAFDVVLAGDDHTPQTHDIGETGVTLTYPGSTERTAADQRHDRGYQLVTIENGAMDIDWQALDTRDFVYVDVEMGDDDGIGRVERKLRTRTDEFEDSVVIVTITGSGDRIPSAPLEELGYEYDALKVQVNDRRSFTEGDRDYRDVSFADPTEAVKDRREELQLSEIALDMEDLARNTDDVADSNLADITEDRVDDLLEERDIEAFERPDEPEVMTAPSVDTPDTETDSAETGGGDEDTAVSHDSEGGDARVSPGDAEVVEELADEETVETETQDASPDMPSESTRAQRDDSAPPDTDHQPAPDAPTSDSDSDADAESGGNQLRLDDL